MIWPLIAASAGAVGLNYQASKDLEAPSKNRSQSMWPVFALGAVTGLWIGVSFAQQINGSFAFAEKWIGWYKSRPDSEDETSSEEEQETRKKRKKIAK